MRSPSACSTSRRPGSAASSTSSRRWTTSSASASASRTSTRPARSSRPASSRCARAGPTTPRTTGTLELRRALSRASRAALRRPLRPGDGDPHHGRRLRGRGPRPARDVRPGRRGHPPRALVRRLCPGDRLRRRHGPPRGDALRGRLRHRPGRRRGRDHAADEGALPRLPVQPDRRGPAADAVQDALADIAVRHDLLVYSDEIYDRLAYGDYTPPGDERAARDARADDPDGRLLEGVRDDRLAGRLRRGAGRDPRGDRQGPPVRDHVGADDGAGRRPGRRDRGRAGRRADARRVRPPPPAHRRRAQRAGPRDLRAARGVLRVPADHLDRSDRRGLHGGPAHAGARRGRPGERLRAVRGRPRADVLRDLVRAAGGGAPPDRTVRRSAPPDGQAGRDSSADSVRPATRRSRSRRSGRDRAATSRCP